nr:MAG TPA: hypothetical protein [Caudoviricetes sp.]
MLIISINKTRHTSGRAGRFSFILNSYTVITFASVSNLINH